VLSRRMAGVGLLRPVPERIGLKSRSLSLGRHRIFLQSVRMNRR
jgi:hypothetical protein